MNKQSKNKILLIDGNSLLFRAFYGSINNATLRSATGIPTNAVYSMIRMLHNFLKANNYWDVVLAFDRGKNTFRHKMMADYKAGRNKTPNELLQQFAIMKEYLAAVGLKYFEHDDYEADDLIASLAILAQHQDLQVDILSSDRDLMQLINNDTRMLSPQKGTSIVKVYDEATFINQYQITPCQVIDWKALEGDPSDNIKGVPGVGRKTATALLQKYDNIEGILANLNDLKPKIKASLTEFRQKVFDYRYLVTLVKDIDLDDLQFSKYQINEHQQQLFYQKYNFKSLMTRSPLVPISVKIISKWSPAYEAKINFIYLELTAENYFTAEAIGIAVYNNKGTFFYPWSDWVHDSEFRAFLEAHTSQKIVFNAKLIINWCRRFNYDIHNITDDLMIMGYLVHNTMHSDIVSHINFFLSYNMNTFNDFFGKGTKFKVPENNSELAQYIGGKAKLMAKLHATLTTSLQRNEQWRLYQEVELPSAFVLADMEWYGVKVDITLLNTYLITTADQINHLKNKIFKLLDLEFNINSPRQLADVLFNQLKLPQLTKKPTTNQAVLKKLKAIHPVIDLILQYRQISKLYNNYLKGIAKNLINGDEIHTIYKNAFTNTGRLSSINPNMQNLAVKNEKQNFVKRLFIPHNQNSKFLSCDYSQIELKLLAELSQEPKLIKAFCDNEDIHTTTAMTLFGKTNAQQVTAQERKKAKTINFSIIYGVQPFGLQESLHINYDQAKQLITNYYENYPEILQFKQNILAAAQQSGYVETPWHRRRFVPDLKSNNQMTRQAAERTAINMPIQGMAADIIKKAMVTINQAIKLQKLTARLIMQIHDELILEFNPAEYEQIKAIVEIAMNQAISMSVPLTIHLKQGANLKDLS